MESPKTTSLKEQSICKTEDDAEDPHNSPVEGYPCTCTIATGNPCAVKGINGVDSSSALKANDLLKSDVKVEQEAEEECSRQLLDSIFGFFSRKMPVGLTELLLELGY